MLQFIQAVPLYIWVIALLLLFGTLSYIHAKRDMKDLQLDWQNAQNFEPVLGASPASFITTPLYRLFRLLGVDLLTSHGVFLALTSFLVYQTMSNLELLKTAWFIPAFLMVIWFLACVNFAMPEHRGKVVDAVVNVVNAIADKIRGDK